MRYLMSWLFGSGAGGLAVSANTKEADAGGVSEGGGKAPETEQEPAMFRIEQTAESSTLLENDSPILVIEHSDGVTARLKVKMLLLNEAQERTGPGDVLKLA